MVLLWRASLLCKRIIFLSEPPIGRVCWWVQWVWLLGAHTTPGLPSSLLRPLYYVSLADLDLLAEQHSYVACECLLLVVCGLSSSPLPVRLFIPLVLLSRQ